MKKRAPAWIAGARFVRQMAAAYLPWRMLPGGKE